MTSAVAVSGIVDEAFIYLGFLPRNRGERRRLFESLAFERRPVVAFESPRRIRQSLQAILEILDDRLIAVCREMTKLHEEVFRGTASEALSHFEQPRGEFTLVIEGCAESSDNDSDPDALASTLLRQLRREGTGAKHAVSHVAAVTGLSRRQVYQLWLDTAATEHHQETE